MYRHVIVFALLACVAAACTHERPAAAPREAPRAMRKLGDVLEEGVIVQLQVAWEAPGVLVETGDRGEPQVGSLQVRMLGDGALEAGVFDPDGERSDGDGWVRLRSEALLPAREPHRVTVAIGPALILLVDGAEQLRIAASGPWPEQSLFLGPFEESAVAGGSDLPPGMSGRVLIESVGPGDADFSLVTLERRATALEPSAPEEAGRISRRMIGYAPREASGFVARARGHMRLGDLEAARADVDAALEMQPPLATAWRLRGWLRHERGDTSGAVADIEQSLELEEDAQARAWLAAWREDGSAATDGAGVRAVRALQPAARAQVVEFDGGPRIDVPRELVASPVTLSVDRGAVPPSPLAEEFERLAGYDVTLGDQRDLAEELRLSMPYDPTRLGGGVPPEAGLIAGRYDRAARTWIELPVDVDEATRTVTVRTRHLSWIEVYYVGSGYRILPGGTFGVFFHEDKVRAAKEDPDPQNTYQAKHPSKLSGVPDYVNDIHQFALEALETYVDHGLRPYSSPVWILVCGTGSSSYNRVLRRAFITFDAGSSSELQYVVSHELFHAVQLASYDTSDYLLNAHRWWLEASAEYAGARLPHRFAKMGKLTEVPMMPAKLLTVPVDYFGEVHEADLQRYHQYYQAYLLEWLARAARSADDPSVEHAWVAMYKHVAAHRDLGAIGAIDDFLKRRLGPTMGFDRHFRDFALHYLLDPASPMGRTRLAQDGRRRETIAGDGLHPVAIESTRDADLRDGRVAEFLLTTPANHTAHLWAFELEPASGPVEVSLGAPLPSRSALFLARLPGGDRTGHEIVARFDSADTSADTSAATFTLEAEDGLVAILVNDGPKAASVAMRLRAGAEPTEASCMTLRLCDFDGMWVGIMRGMCDKCAAGDTALDSCGACGRFKLAVDRCAGQDPWIPDDRGWLGTGNRSGLEEAYRRRGPHSVNVGYADTRESTACYELLPGLDR